MFDDKVFNKNASNVLPDYTETVTNNNIDDIEFEKGLIEKKK